MVCIVDNSARIGVSTMENFLIWIRIIHTIDALVLRVMASKINREKDLIESITSTRARNSGIVYKHSAKLRFAYRLSSSINLSAVSGISGDIRFLNY